MAMVGVEIPIFRGSNRDKVYMDAVDKNVSKTIIYANVTGDTLTGLTPYADEAGTRVLSAEELLDAYLKGAVVSIHMSDHEVVSALLSAYCDRDAATGERFVIASAMAGDSLFALKGVFTAKV